MKQIAAIPTMYNGIQFRSRLEATWARFFDLLELNWTYEPEGFDGWIPDFMVYGDSDYWFVEVKPMLETSSGLDSNVDRYKKLSKACDESIVLVGRDPSKGIDFARTTKCDLLSNGFSPFKHEHCFGFLVDHRLHDVLHGESTLEYGWDPEFIPAIPISFFRCRNSGQLTIGTPNHSVIPIRCDCIHCGNCVEDNCIKKDVNKVCFDNHNSPVDVTSDFRTAKNKTQWSKS